MRPHRGTFKHAIYAVCYHGCFLQLLVLFHAAALVGLPTADACNSMKSALCRICWWPHYDCYFILHGCYIQSQEFFNGGRMVRPTLFFCLWVRWYMCNIHIQNVNIWGGGLSSPQITPPGIWHMHSVLWEESLKRSHYIRFCTTGIIITLNCICNNVHQLQIEHDAARSSYACFKHCFKMYVVVQQKNQWLLKNRASAESVSHCTKWASTSIPTHSKCSRLSWVQQEDRFVLKRIASVSHHSEQEHKWHTCTDTEKKKMCMKQQRAVPCDPLRCYTQLANTKLIIYIFCPMTMTLWGQMKTFK